MQDVRGTLGPGWQGEFAETEKRGRGLAVEAHGGEQGGGTGEIPLGAVAKIGHGFDGGANWEREESGEGRCELRVELGAALYSGAEQLGFGV